MYAVEMKGIIIHHINLSVFHSTLLYLINWAFLPMLLRGGSSFHFLNTGSERLDTVGVGGWNCSNYIFSWVMVCSLVL